MRKCARCAGYFIFPRIAALIVRYVIIMVCLHGHQTKITIGHNDFQSYASL